MNTETKHLLSTLKGLLSINLKMADRHDLNEISITKARAREILFTINDLEKRYSKIPSKHIKKEPAWLDNPC